MKINFYLRIAASILCALATLGSSSSHAQVCNLPQAIERPSVRAVDYQNLDRTTDYYALVLSWSPNHCDQQKTSAQRAKHAFQCTLNAFEFVVHGLWPQDANAKNLREHPRHCNTSGALPHDLIKMYMCIVPGADLMQNEWQAHGTCAWDSAEKYFQRIQTEFERFPKPARVAFSDANGKSTPGKIKAAFVQSSEGRLSPDQLAVFVAKGNQLKEVWICLDKQFEPTSCQGQGTSNHKNISVPKPRSLRSGLATHTPTEILTESAEASDLDCPRAQTKFADYSKGTRQAFWNQLYVDGGKTIYCGARFRAGSRETQGGLPINIEHAVPKSRFDARPAKGDLHNLWPSITLVNSARSNYLLVDDIPGETSAFAEHANPELSGCDFELQSVRRPGGGKVTVVEPVPAARGPLARATLHMALAYPSLKLSEAEWAMYLAWHKTHPVDGEEQRRNDVIEAEQGTRNPFVDSPDSAVALIAGCRIQ